MKPGCEVHDLPWISSLHEYRKLSQSSENAESHVYHCRLERDAAGKAGVMSSLRRRAVSAVTLPFDLVSGVTAGIASTTGIDRKATPRHAARTPGGNAGLVNEWCVYSRVHPFYRHRGS